jgi:PAB1-binding protein PBP1
MKYYKLIKKYPSLPKNWEDGMLVGQGDRGCNAEFSPCSGKYTDFYIRPEEVINNPEFWKEEKENSEEFIIENKPSLSYKDVEKILSKYIPNENYCLKEIKKLAKDKINNYGN